MTGDTQKSSPVFIVSGKRRGGKTTFLVGLIEHLTGKGLVVDGILALSSSGSEFPDSYLLKHIKSGRLIPLCCRKPEEKWIRTGNFFFNPEALDAGNRILTHPEIIHNNLVIIDEIGRFELDGLIWAGSLSWLTRIGSCPMILSVRETLIDQVVENWDLQNVEIIDISTLTLSSASEILIKRIKINKP